MKFLSPDFVEFIECCDRREVRFLIVGGVEAGFISLPDLIANKRAAGQAAGPGRRRRSGGPTPDMTTR